MNNGDNETVQWTLTDHLNTVRDIAKYDRAMDSTSIVNHLLYDAFGRVTSETNPAVDSLFLFTARPFDSDSQLQNNLNRWYDPAVGRWLSEDPIGFAGGDGNLYRYVGNGVLTGLDSTGQKEREPSEAYLDAIESASTMKDFVDAIRDNKRIGSLSTLAEAGSQLLQNELSTFVRLLTKFQPESE